MKHSQAFSAKQTFHQNSKVCKPRWFLKILTEKFISFLQVWCLCHSYLPKTCTKVMSFKPVESTYKLHATYLIKNPLWRRGNFKMPKGFRKYFFPYALFIVNGWTEVFQGTVNCTPLSLFFSTGYGFPFPP